MSRMGLRPPRALACALFLTGACSEPSRPAADRGRLPTSSSPPAAAEPSFEKITLSDEFFSEGAGVGDFNRDGKLDVVAGQLWVEGPAFETKHEFTAPVKADP